MAMQIPGVEKKLRQSAKRSRTDESVGRELVFLRVLVCGNRAIGGMLEGRGLGKRKRHGATLCRVGDLE